MRKHIAVVGGGFAGLAAANELLKLGFDVTVLEARQRLGGRVRSETLSNGAIVELGGEWITPGDQTVIMMANRLNVSLIPVGVDFKIRQVVSGPSVSADEQRRTTKIATKTLSRMDRKSIAQSSLGEFLDELPVSKPQRELLRCRLQGSYGTDLQDVALRMIGDYSLGPSRGYFRIATGNQSMAMAMAAEIPDVRLGHAASTVTHHQDGISIEGEATSAAFRLEADAVIIAIPAKRVTKLLFNPVLPEANARAFSSVSMGVAAKLVMGTRKPPPLRAYQDMKVPYWFWTGMGDKGVARSAVTAFCGSKQAQENLATASGDPSVWSNKIQAVIPDVDFIDDPIMVDWSQDEWALGCYSAFDNPATDLIPILSQPVGRIFFAGEHTAVDSGTMEGALASGLQAARQISEVF